MTRLVGVDGAVKVYAKVDRRITKERQGIFRTVARRVILPQMKFEAMDAPGKAGPALAKSITARNGKMGAVLAGPRSGRRGAWYRAIFIAGHPSPWRITSKKGKRLLYNPDRPFLASGIAGVTHPPLQATPFVERAQRATTRPFTEAVAAALYPEAKT